MVSVGKISVSMPTDVIETVKAAAAAEGISVSAWMTHAADQAADRARRVAIARAAADELVAEVEALTGTIPQAAVEGAAAVRPGFPRRDGRARTPVPRQGRVGGRRGGAGL
jgi:hypothetical protein